MNEEGTTPTAPTETPVANINSEEGGVTAADVADVMHLAKSEPTPETPAEPETPAPEEPTTPAAPVVEAPMETTPAASTIPEAPTFSLEIEDANGKKFTLGPDDNLETVLAEFEPKNNGQIIQLMRDLDKLSVDKSNHEAKQVEAATEAERSQTISNIQAGWDKEIESLQGAKRIPVGADGKPNQDRVNQVFKLMSDENTKRQEEGRPLIQSFEDALDKVELQETRQAEKDADKAAKEDARRRGGLVGGSSAPATSSAPVYHAGQARNANEAIQAMGLLK